METCLEGYQRITLMKEGIKKRYMCHRLVAQEFIPNPENKPFINHIDGNPSSNKVENLEWCTQSENELHSVRVLGKSMKGKTYPKRVMSIENSKVYSSMSQCIEALGNHACVEGLNKAIRFNRKYHGFTFVRV